MMKYRTFLILALALLLPFTFSCDNDNNSNAQDMGELEMPGEEITDCPCFTELEILDAGENAEANFCTNTIWGLLLDFTSETDLVFSAMCKPDGTSCQCQKGPPNAQNGIDISANEVGACMQVQITGLILLAEHDIFLACNFTP